MRKIGFEELDGCARDLVSKGSLRMGTEHVGYRWRGYAAHRVSSLVLIYL